MHNKKSIFAAEVPFVLALALVLISTPAKAVVYTEVQPCSTTYSQVAAGTYPLWEAQLENPHCFASSNPATSLQMTATTFQQITSISSALGNRLLPFRQPTPSGIKQASLVESGLAAGGEGRQWNFWGNVSENVNRYNATITSGTVVSSANVSNIVLGGDFQASRNIVMGVSAAFDRGRGSVGANPTASQTSGYALAPYVGFQINDKFAVDASVGFGNGESSVGTSRTDASRTFLAGNATYADWHGNWQFTGKLGYLWAREKSSDTRNNGAVLANSAATATVAQARAGIEASYWLGNGVMPFVGLAYSADVVRKVQGTAPWDKTGLTISAGINFVSVSDKITGGIVYSDETGRRYTRNSTLMGNLNIRF